MNSNPKIKPSDFTSGAISYEPKVNPVYALDVERNGYWCLSGCCRVDSMIYNEGAIHHYFPHNEKALTAYNVEIWILRLNFLSGVAQGRFQIFRPQGLGDITFEVDADLEPKNENSDVDSLFGDSDEDNDGEGDKDDMEEDKVAKANTKSDSRGKNNCYIRHDFHELKQRRNCQYLGRSCV
ncbi:hypothetical protein CJI97_000829 [Candidozyma auris]|nr:hypothetical protein CJI97_000829 [[Candida] auris]